MSPWTQDNRPRADAIVTRVPQLAIGVSTADCGPLLFADSEAGVIGAAHAGWRGALTGVIEATIAAMERLGAGRNRISGCTRPHHSAAKLRGRCRNSSSASSQPIRQMHAFLRRRNAMDTPCSTSPAISPNGFDGRVSLSSKILACAPLPSPSGSSATGARRKGASPTMDASQRHRAD